MHRCASVLPLLSSLFCLLGLLAASAQAEQFTFEHENVLGTSMHLRIQTTSANEAEKIEQTVLTEIDRLAKIFSSYDADSQLRRWQAGQLNAEDLSQELITVLARSEYWRQQTSGAFDVRAIAFTEVWKSAATAQKLPDARALADIVGKLDQPPYRIAEGKVERMDQLLLTLDALAKGYILDTACKAAHAEHASAAGLSLMIGGDMCKTGSMAEIFSISDPHLPDLNSPPKASFQLKRPMGMATSGGYRRFVEINGQRYSHIIDPRTGWPANQVASVTVLASSAMDADALATSISVLGMREGLALVEELPNTACLIVSNSGDVVYSQRWTELTTTVAGKLITTQQQPEDKKSATKADKSEAKPKDGLFVSFTLKQTGGGRYRRPYVAVWLEDKDGYPVKTAVLWLQATQPGPRWHRDLTRWYSNDRMRKLAEDTELIGTISSATRGPGQYEARFDGTDNAGQPLKPGKYTLCLEAAREHGSHQLIREDVELGDVAVAKKELKGGEEISAAAYVYAPKQETAK